MYNNITSFENIEKYLIEQGYLNQKVIKESTTFSEYKNNIQKKEYLLLIIADENQRTNLEGNMQEVFNSNYDLINIESKTGKLIAKDIKTKNKILNGYPQLFYFKTGKLITNKIVYNKETIKEFKTNIN